MVRAYLEAARGCAERKPLDQARVVVTGSSASSRPSLGLIKTLERAGGHIVDDDYVQVHRFIEGDIKTEGDPLENLVRAFLDQAVAGPTRYAACGNKGGALVDRVKKNAAEGVLFRAASFCDPALLDQPMAVKAVDQAGIPWTAFKYSENGGQFQVIREQAGHLRRFHQVVGSEA